MKRILLLIFIGCTACSHAQHQVKMLWSSDTTLPTPESVLPDVKNGILYVSLIDGDPWTADGKGGIGKLDTKGKIINAQWITGLNAPKGMGLYANKLYVADITNVVVVDIAQGKIEKKIPVDGAQGLNDITIDSKGVVYISDSKTGKVYRMENGKAAVYLENLKGANGLKATGNNLYILTAKEVYKADAAKKLTVISELETGGDGIEPVGNGDLLATSWSGYIYYVYANGKKDLLLDTHEQKINSADIGYDPAKKIIYVPTFFKKSVVAYQLVK
jgi:hypothetical protein